MKTKTKIGPWASGSCSPIYTLQQTEWSVFVLGPFKFLDMMIKELYVITNKFIGHHASEYSE